MEMAEAVRSIASGEPQKIEHSLQSKTQWEVRQSTVELSQADKGWTQLEVAAGLASLFFSLLFLSSFFQWVLRRNLRPPILKDTEISNVKSIC